MTLFIPTLPDYEVSDSFTATLTRDYRFGINGIDYIIRKGFKWDGTRLSRLTRRKRTQPFDSKYLVGELVFNAVCSSEVEYASPDATYHGIPCSADFTRLEVSNIYFALIHKFGVPILHALKDWAVIILLSVCSRQKKRLV